MTIRQCHYCGVVVAMPESWSERSDLPRGVFDHRTPRSRGGRNDPYNLEPACWRCNSSKGSKPYLQFIFEECWGYKVPDDEYAAEVRRVGMPVVTMLLRERQLRAMRAPGESARLREYLDFVAADEAS